MSKYEIIINLILLGIAVVSSYAVFKQDDIRSDYYSIDLTDINKLMIVAHPDDEILWGGSHLLDEKYLVVCITCGLNKTRVNEFRKVMEKTGNEYVMLGYPDKVLNIRSNWKEERPKIYTDIYNIMELKDWDTIVTHNKVGEYGHEHHVMTHEIVMEAFNDINPNGDLYFFGKYYTKKNLQNLAVKPPRISDENLEKKLEVLKLYKSQKSTVEMLGHMNPYEDWTKYDNIISYEKVKDEN